MKFEEDEAVYCIPASLIVGKTVGDKCKVKWTDGEIYNTTILVSGLFRELYILSVTWHCSIS